MILEERWEKLMFSLGLPVSRPTFECLVSAYSEKHRHYHNLKHIQDCFNKLDLASNLTRHSQEIELAFWFHDAIYQPYRSQNEQKSAEWASQFLKENNAATELMLKVNLLILSTVHNEKPMDPHAQLLVDIDLSILGAEDATYDHFEACIRKEYRWVPGFLYRKKRAELLKSFLARDSIYCMAYFRDKYEAKARENLKRALQKLLGD